MLEVRLSEDGKHVRVVIMCDFCGEPINKEQTGIPMWRVEEEGPSGRIFFLHNGEKRCTRRHEQNFPGNWAWAPLEFVLKQLGISMRKTGGAS